MKRPSSRLHGASLRVDDEKRETRRDSSIRENDAGISPDPISALIFIGGRVNHLGHKPSLAQDKLL